ncbi:hypothetical protein ACVWZ4_000712 [Bradyrhizobium sp. USDA 4472]
MSKMTQLLISDHDIEHRRIADRVFECVLIFDLLSTTGLWMYFLGRELWTLASWYVG